MKINGDLIYKVGDTITSTSSSNPADTLGGTWTLISTLAGGSLLSVGILKGTTAGTQTVENSWIAISDNYFGTKAIYTKKMSSDIPNIFTLESGTIKCYPNGIVGMVEADIGISGHWSDSSNNHGIWWGTGNHNALPTGVSILGQNSTGRGFLTAAPGLIYDTLRNSYYYNINKGITADFYINPDFKSYSATFLPGGGGVLPLEMVCKAYSISDTLYTWKKTV